MTKKIYRQSNFYQGEGSRKTNKEEGECQMGGGGGLGKNEGVVLMRAGWVETPMNTMVRQQYSFISLTKFTHLQ